MAGVDIGNDRSRAAGGDGPGGDRIRRGEIAGRGAMGTVYRAYQRTMDRIVAVKILRPEIVREAGVLKRFVREARAAARLQHPNVLTPHASTS